MKDIIPIQPLIGFKKKRNKSTNKIKKQKTNNIEPEQKLMTFMGDNNILNPFSDSRSFVMYYRRELRKINNNANFERFDVDVLSAAIIMDILIENNKNKSFLDSWIKFFIERKLYGNKIYNPYSTSLKELYKTFERFNKIYYVPEK